ncbi:hypothetical protein [Halopiger xanaduensis]|uniref:Methyltransferase n=1 Tax=Halopiger xanaduensis (strain DSM 18323 / JCM 14033 / SH-6) TaxID=797210 RepID=F8DES8_HALXS|nr:hypothetical protein [Halopiger xanaduensis]AEH39518.1 hypothetical protein Halxa_0278 [Halopiger xanaduensis SH-6]
MTVEYVIGDALERLRDEPAGSAAFVHLDDAWARPNRNGAFGVEYPTHPFDEDVADDVAGEPGVETDLTVVDMLEACYRVLEPGGVLAVDTDSHLCPRVLTYAIETWGRGCYAVHETTLLTKAGEPDRSTPGMYASSGGYSTVLVWKNAAPLPRGYAGREYHQLRCACRNQREDWGWGTVKPLAPALGWIRTYTDAGDRVIVPCAGTAPAAIAAEREYGSDVDVLAIDVEPEAREAYQRRRTDELEYQSGLGMFGKTA